MSASPPLRVEVQGTWLPNLGARQLLDAVVRALHRIDPDAVVALDPRWGSRRSRDAAGVRSIAPRAFPGSPGLERGLATASTLTRGGVDRLLGHRQWVGRHTLGALVDASGFALSDQWGPEKARQRAGAVDRYAARGCPVVLLPQAMGPFADPATARAAREALTRADAVWVRDRTSLRHVHDLVGAAAHVRLAPDVTILEAGEPPVVGAANVVLVPNGRLVVQGGWARADYVAALVDVGRAARRADRTVEVLLHTTEAGDAELGVAVADALGCPVTRDDDPRRVKGRLATAEVVVGSRFHALLGALAQGVPALALGWSHKYEELFADFGVPELGGFGDSTGDLVATLTEVLATPGDVRQRVAAGGARQRERVEAMWAEVAGVLGRGATAGVR